MKKLLHKTLRIFTLYALMVLAASVPAYYYLVDNIWLKELDEHNQIMADKTQGEINALNLMDQELAQSVALWNKIQAGTELKKINSFVKTQDSFYTVLKRNIHVQNNDLKRYRGLSRNIILNGQPFSLSVETNVEETEETVIAIAVVTFLFFLLLVIGFLVLNKRLSQTLWLPFRSTLQRLKTFKLHSQHVVEFERSDTIEFEELNDALTRLIEQNISIYKTQKEFAENASHELQTPLAIIKNKLDLLLQYETVTERQYDIIEEINRALTRISRINKNLLLLAKIENQQYDRTQIIGMRLLMTECLRLTDSYNADKNIRVNFLCDDEVLLTGNYILIEVMMTNLIMNAIRHTPAGAEISVALDQVGMVIRNTGSSPLTEGYLFKRFAKKSGETSGTGLGLSIVKEICHMHHWKINYFFENKLHNFYIKF